MRSRTCDICGRPATRIIAKLFLAPVDAQSNTRKTHSEYTGHADVGDCCASEILGGKIKWQTRKKMPRKVKASV